MSMENIKTTSEIIDALGGTRAVARLISQTDASVSTWRKKGFPKAWERYFKSEYPHLFGLAKKKTPPPAR